MMIPERSIARYQIVAVCVPPHKDAVETFGNSTVSITMGTTGDDDLAFEDTALEQEHPQLLAAMLTWAHDVIEGRAKFLIDTAPPNRRDGLRRVMETIMNGGGS